PLSWRISRETQHHRGDKGRKDVNSSASPDSRTHRHAFQKPLPDTTSSFLL
ncbi:Eukaryotic translation initiation factor 3 subunit A, partial [Dissostichus eleginoides]